MAVVEVRSPGVTVVLDGRTLRINARRETLGRVALSDIDMLVLEVPSVGVSGAALAALAAAGIPALVCDGQHRPAAWLNPVAVADSFDPDRARRQAGLPERTRARLWRQIVRAKIAAQADMLAEAGFPDGPLRALVEKVAPATRPTSRRRQRSDTGPRCSAAASDGAGTHRSPTHWTGVTPCSGPSSAARS